MAFAVAAIFDSHGYRTLRLLRDLSIQHAWSSARDAQAMPKSSQDLISLHACPLEAHSLQPNELFHCQRGVKCFGGGPNHPDNDSHSQVRSAPQQPEAKRPLLRMPPWTAHAQRRHPRFLRQDLASRYLAVTNCKRLLERRLLSSGYLPG